MSAKANYPQGLTRIIFEALVAMTPELAAEGASLTPELLGRVESDVHRRLAPEGNGRDRLIFDMVFNRSFAEARDLVLNTSRRPSRPRAVGRAPLQATA